MAFKPFYKDVQQWLRAQTSVIQIVCIRFAIAMLLIKSSFNGSDVDSDISNFHKNRTGLTVLGNGYLYLYVVSMIRSPQQSTARFS